MANILSKAGRTVWRFFKRLLQGDGVSSRFFIKHIFVTGFAVAALILMIAMRFENATNDNLIDSLKKEINEMETEKQKQRAFYMTLTRESAMMHLVDSLRLGLTIPDKRPKEVPASLSD